MFMRLYALLILWFLCICKCSASKADVNEITNDRCDSIALKIQYLFSDYQEYGEEYKLDSIIQIINTISGKCHKYDANFYLQRIIAFSFKGDYSRCLEYAQLMNDSIFGYTYKTVIINRFKAMIAQKNGDIGKKNKYINTIIKTLKEELPEREVDSVLRLQNADSIVRYKKITFLSQYYYYLSQIQGIDEVNSYLDKKYGDTDNNHMWVIKPKNIDFMIFTGI